MNYLALNIKGSSVSYGSLYKCYKGWKLTGMHKNVEAPIEDVDKVKELIAKFAGIQDYKPFSYEDKKILDSFLKSNDGGMFYIYMDKIDLFYNFMLCWRIYKVRDEIKFINIPIHDKSAFDLFSYQICNSGKKGLLNQVSTFLSRILNKQYRCLENIIKLYSLSGFDFDENSVADKTSIMNVLATITDFLEYFDDSILSIIHYMISNNIKTGTFIDNYLINFMYLSLAEKGISLEKEYDIEESSVEDDVLFDIKPIWPLPKDFFNLPSADKNEYFGDIKEVAKNLESFECLINYLSSEGYIEYNDNSKRILAFVLTGKSKPNVKIEKIEWKKSCNDLAYICRHFYNFNGRYNRIRDFFKYEGDDKPLKSNYADNASKNLQQKINELFPTLEKSK